MMNRWDVQLDDVHVTDDAVTTEVNLFLHRFHGVKQAVPSAEAVERTRGWFPDAPDPVVVVARLSGRVVGAATAWTPIILFEPLHQMKGLAAASKILNRWRVFTHLAVGPENRGQGVGRALVERLEDVCRQSGAVALFGFAEDLPDPSWPFYQHLGYRILGLGEHTEVGGIPTRQAPGRKGRDFDKRLGKA